MKSLNMPPSSKAGFSGDTVIQTESSVVVIGANGAGKTRLGAWLEFQTGQDIKVHRISAQKSLTMPSSLSPVPLPEARNLLYFGLHQKSGELNIRHKWHLRWRDAPETHLLNDFDNLLTFLFSENYEKVLEYTEKQKCNNLRIDPPTTLLDRLKNIWENILPHRKLEIHSGNIDAAMPESKEIKYNASSMSDGERVIFYLIGECLCAPDKCTIIIDEPEIHLHKSIQARLWDKIEQERPDCLFVYLTHDLDFAASRMNATKICLESYDGNDFSWYIVPAVNDIPERILLEVVGVRKPLIFVEGEEGSLDTQIYRLAYKDHTIRPLGSCSKVIESTKAFNDISDIHRIAAYGIIDRDYKSQQHVDSYKGKNIFCPDVAEVENLFLLEEVLFAVGNQFCFQNAERKVCEIKNWVINEFKTFSENFATESTIYEINMHLGGFNGKAHSISDLSKIYRQFVDGFKLDEVYQKKLAYSDKIIRNNDYNAIIQCVNRKALVNQVGKFFDIKPSAYTQKVIDIVQLGNTEIVGAFMNYLPTIPK
ncbi:DUF4435 domain-containing protein [Desulfatibacillum aliphaticivorans]|uniref:DUF4435 domain-containing protein n=1 Tax=Desulfatibacillum aliphaticivorans TaxID=218208 RepID=UPI00040437A0|nr:DUF4435 domain-containing protein [Desulfatibacillum aliphaticivorans]